MRIQLVENMLLEMAYDLNKAKTIVNDLATTFRVHWAYIFVLGSGYESYQHWRNELSDYCYIVDNIKVKTKSKKLSTKYITDILTWHIDTDEDARIFIEYAWGVHDGELPPLVELPETLCSQFRAFMNRIYEELPILLVSIEDHTREFFQQYIDQLIFEFQR